MPVSVHSSLSSVRTVPSTGPSSVSVIRPTSSAVGSSSIVRPSMSDTVNAGPFAVGHGVQTSHHGGIQFDALPLQFASQLRTSSPNVTDVRFSGLPLPSASRMHQAPVVQPMYSGCLFQGGPMSTPVGVVQPPTSVPVPTKPVPLSIPYFVASRPPHQFVNPPAPAPAFYRPADGFNVDASKQSTVTQEPPTRP
jgi:hypothetical protein